MKSNVLRFPKELNAKTDEEIMRLNTPSSPLETQFQASQTDNDIDLMRLRDAFDKARLNWPEEEAELPEKNKIRSNR